MYVCQSLFIFGAKDYRNLPIGVVVAALIVIFLNLQGTRNEERALPLKAKLRSLDYLGATLIFGSICCLLLAIQWGGTSYALSSSCIIGLFVGLGVLLTAFAILQWKLGDGATIPFRILGQRSVLMGSLFICCSQGTSMVVSRVTVVCTMSTKYVDLATVGLLFAFLLPSSPKCLCNPEWCSISGACCATGLRIDTVRSNSNCYWSLCKSFMYCLRNLTLGRYRS
jgi:hypothetical protein